LYIYVTENVIAYEQRDRRICCGQN
jgi:hypothetical protein